MPRTCSATPRSACSWRARAAAPGFELTARNAQAIAGICRALDGLPLAIVLAAARIRPLPPGALLARLSDPMSVLTAGPRDLPERQRTLRNTLDWSFGLLSADQKALFARLGVLAGTFGVPAATAICGDSDATDPPRVMDTLGSLATAAWSAPSPMTTSPGSACWRPSESLLGTVREYALDRLREPDYGKDPRNPELPRRPIEFKRLLSSPHGSAQACPHAPVRSTA